MAISRAQLLKELLPGLHGLFGLEYAKYENEHTEIYDPESSDRSFEEETKLSGFGSAPVKLEGAGVTYDTAQEAWTARYDHEVVAMGFAITQEAIEDNLYDSLSARYTKALARGMAYTKQVKAAALLNNGFTTYNSGDDTTLFSTAHPLVGGGTNANRPTTAVDLNETSLENACIQIAGWTDERGLLIAYRPMKLIIPVNSQFIATRVLSSELRVGTTDNDINALRNNSSIPGGWVINHYLTDTDSFYIKTDCPNGLKHFTRVAISNDMDGDFDTGNVRYKSRERYSFGVSDPLGMWATTGAA